MSQNIWNAELYENKHSFVWQYGESLIEILAPKNGECILDLGCGTGQLTQQIAVAGAEVIGIDYAPSMIAQAQKNYPNLKFIVADARCFDLAQSFDAVFSNAALHWIKEPELVIKCIWQALKPGGRFVAEFGGKGNIQGTIQSIVEAISQAMPPTFPIVQSPWYFPSIGEYATLLEQQGFSVTYATLFERPTPLEGEAGLANWIQMFGSHFLSGIPSAQQVEIIQKVEHNLKSKLYRDGTWFVDYQRIRVAAIKN